MKRCFLLVLAVGALAAQLAAQESFNFQNFEVHGFATQGVVYSNQNNYLGMNTSSGNLGWSEAALNVNDQVSDKLRLGVQIHITRLGAFGGPEPTVDWALADYTFNRWVGVRAGKVKIPWGLYNDTQDADPGYLWSLLPEPIYAIDWRATDLAQMGAEVYGKVPMPKKVGELNYRAYYGYYYYSPNDGYLEQMKEEGINTTGVPSGVTPGFDLRWKTPVKGLKVGGSLMLYNARGALVNGKLREPLTFWPTYFAQYEYKKLSLSYQNMKLVQWTDLTIPGDGYSTSVVDQRAWFAMGSYRVTEKLQLGCYYTRYHAAGTDQSDPANYYRDWVASGRYDINSHFYTKLEEHFIDGNGGGFYDFNNPNGLKPRTNVTVAKLGFVF